MRSRELFLALGAYLVVLIVATPATPWEFDELLFLQSLDHYDPIAHHPPPPGYPLFVAAGKIARLFSSSNFAALVGLNCIASAIGFVLLALAFRNIAGDLTTGVAGSLLFYLSPALLVHAPLALSDPGAVALLAATLYVGSSGGSPALLGAFASLAVGWRPQFAIFVVPLLVVNVAMMREWRKRAATLAVFTVVCLLWLAPLAKAVGGVEELLRFEASQARYVGKYDADVSRSGWTPARIAFRFIAHPWGTKVLSFPVLIVAGAGIVRMIRSRGKRAAPLAVAALLYLGFALRFMDPADGARYAIPFVLATAFFAAVGVVELLRHLGVPAYVLVALFAGGSLFYVRSVLLQRRSSDSPPLQAARFARERYPRNAVVLYELPLWPHAQVFFADRQKLRVNEGLTQYFDRADVPLFIYADGNSRAPGATTFRWQPSDAYSKLTRNHYRVVSIIPVPPQRRYRPLRGVYAPEREPDGEEWQWLDSPAELQLPRGPKRTVTLRFRIPAIYPIEVNTLKIAVGGGDERTVELRRGSPMDVELTAPAGAPVIRVETARTFVPAEVPASGNRDRRRLGVQLLSLEQR